MSIPAGVMSVFRFLIRVICSSVYISIAVPIGIILNIPPLVYWMMMLAVNTTDDDVETVAPFLSHKPAETEQGSESKHQHKPRIFFDGCAWCISFEMGVCQHLLQVPS